MTIAGLILAGGRASRMGGGDKTLLEIDGRSLLSLLIARLAPQCQPLLISANGDASRFAACELPVIADTVPNQQGPLAGVLAGLDWLAEKHPENDMMLSVPADTPFVPLDLAARLAQAIASNPLRLATAASRGHRHPAITLWPQACRMGLRHAFLNDNMRRVGNFIDQNPHVIVDWPNEPDDPFFNINTPSDLKVAQARAHLLQSQS